MVVRTKGPLLARGRSITLHSHNRVKNKPRLDALSVRSVKGSGYLLGRVLRARHGGARWWLRYSTPILSRGYKSKEMKPIDEGMKLGDYPQLPWISAQELPPTGWWDDQDRRNKEDPLHEQDDILNMWVCDIIENNGRYTRWEALGQLVAMFSLLGVIFGLSVLYDAPSRNPCVPRQFPYNNLYLARGGDPNALPEGENQE